MSALKELNEIKEILANPHITRAETILKINNIVEEYLDRPAISYGPEQKWTDVHYGGGKRGDACAVES